LVEEEAQQLLALVTHGIFKKNSEAAKEGKVAKNSHLLDIVAKPEMLMLAYKLIKGNKGAMTPAAPFDKVSYLKLSYEQKALVLNTFKAPDGLTLNQILLTSSLLKEGKYPWGVRTGQRSSPYVSFFPEGNFGAPNLPTLPKGGVAARKGYNVLLASPPGTAVGSSPYFSFST
jgi:hypothetical protein